MRLKRVVIVGACIASSFQGISQMYAPPVHLSGRTGLSHRWVNHIMQDSRGFLWFSTIDGLNLYDGHDFTVFRPSDSDTIADSSHDWIWWAIEDTSGTLKLSTKGGVHLFDIQTKRFTFFPFNTWDLLSQHRLNAIGIQRKDERTMLWKPANPFPWTEDSIALYAFTSDNKPQHVRSWNSAPPSFFLSNAWDHAWIWSKEKGWQWLNINDGTTIDYGSNGTEGRTAPGNLPLDLKQRVFSAPVGDGSTAFHQIPLPEDAQSLIAENFLRDDQGDWWYTVGDNPTRLYHFDSVTQALQEIGTLPIQFVHSICEDREGTIWVGHQLGVTKFLRTNTWFENYLDIPFSPGGEAPLGIACRSMVEDLQGNLYVEDHHALYRLPINATVAEQITLDLVDDDDQPVDASPGYLFADSDGEIWMALQSGIARYNPITGEAEIFRDPMIRGNFSQILEDKQGRFWIPVMHEHGEYSNVLFDTSTGKFSYAKCRHVNLDLGGMQTDADILWAFHPTGLLKVNCAEEVVDSIYLYDDIRDQRQAVFLDDALWIASSRGLVNVDVETWDYRTFNRTHGLPADFVYSILPDDPYLWLGTADGLCRFNMQTYETQNYFTTDGLSHNEFNTQSVLKTRDGRYVMGGLNGINVFRPEVLNAPAVNRPHLYCVKITKYDSQKRATTEVPVMMYDSLAPIVFDHSDRSFSFKFALTSFRDNSKNRYAYYLEGLEVDWRAYSNSPFSTYAHIPPGTYVLHVKAVDPNGIESANRLWIPITMLRPWYTRWWAFVLYGLLLVGLSFFVYRDLLRRRLEQAENLRLRELDGLKTKIYTGITHEFRTPLTIILGLTRQWLRRKDPASVHEDEYRTVERNGQRLLQLVNQMLDLRKLESGKMVPNYVQGDVTPLLRYIFDSFHSYALGKDIDFRNAIPAESIVMDHDADKLTKIVTNLLSNAIKFTPEGGTVELRAALTDSPPEPCLVIEVIDTGEGIAAGDLPHIFSRFFQADNTVTHAVAGTGIGLTLTKELVDLLGGDIAVKSAPGKGSAFTVTLPVTHDAQLVQSTWMKPEGEYAFFSSVPEIVNEEEGIVPGRACVLIVEDNAEVARYTASCLGREYQVRFAVNGEEGINKAYDLIPDLVISDVMMPLKDGFELVRTLKNDLRTSHIPVILLTARADVEDRLEGLRRGADAYLSKPFNEEELRLLIAQLLDLRKKLQARYANTVSTSEVERAPVEEESKIFDLEIEDTFYRNVLHILEENYDNASFSNEELYRQMHISRTQLHRKLSALTGHTPNQLLLQIRLRKARELLSSTDHPISEIAYTTGFNQPSYFTRAFTKENGLTPSEYRAQHSRK